MSYQKTIELYQADTENEKLEKKIILDYIKLLDKKALDRESMLAHITSTAMVFNEAKDKILMIHHNIFDTWACVGGHADGNPDLLAVAFQELAEETGITKATAIANEPLSLDILQVHSHLKRGSYVPNHLHLNVTFALETSQSNPYRIKEDENSGVMWIPIPKIEEFTKEKEFIEVYHKIIKKVSDIYR